jgi:hypothetical protein
MVKMPKLMHKLIKEFKNYNLRYYLDNNYLLIDINYNHLINIQLKLRFYKNFDEKDCIYNGYCIKMNHYSNLFKKNLNENKLYPQTFNYSNNIAMTSTVDNLIPDANPVKVIFIRCYLTNNELRSPKDVLFLHIRLFIIF